MSVEGREFPPVGSMKYFKICEGYELKPMAFSRHISSHLCKICSFQPNSVPNITKNQRTVTKIFRFLNIFHTKIVIAQVLDDTLNLLKESLISTYLTSTSLLFIERHHQFFVPDLDRNEGSHFPKYCFYYPHH